MHDWQSLAHVRREHTCYAKSPREDMWFTAPPEVSSYAAAGAELAEPQGGERCGTQDRRHAADEHPGLHE